MRLSRASSLARRRGSSLTVGGIGNFTVTSAGQMLTPYGKPFHGYGCCIWDNNTFGGTYVGDVITGGASLAATIRAALPGMNICRVAAFTLVTGFRSPSAFAPFINSMTAAGVACVLENHNTAQTVLTGAALTTDTNWYNSCASYYASNPLVMFQSMNEPGDSAGMCAQMLAEYNAVRAGGNNNTFFCEAGLTAWGGGVGNPVSTLDNTAVFAQMHNVGWDYHTYSVPSGVSSTRTLTQCLSDENSVIVDLQALHSADGIMAVISLEGGNSVAGSTVDASGANMITTSYTNTSLAGFTMWLWQNNTLGSLADGLTNSDGLTLNATGTSVASLISAGRISGYGPVGP